jgi:hypothetical protein
MGALSLRGTWTESCHDSFLVGLSASDGGLARQAHTMEKSFDSRESVIAGDFFLHDSQGGQVVCLGLNRSEIVSGFSPS